MTGPDDETLTDAPLVPDLRPTNRQTIDRRDADRIRRELRRLRSRIDDLEADLARRRDD